MCVCVCVMNVCMYVCVVCDVCDTCMCVYVCVYVCVSTHFICANIIIHRTHHTRTKHTHTHTHTQNNHAETTWSR